MSYNYPSWICAPCGEHLQPDKKHRSLVATFHEPDVSDKNDRCGWCGTNVLALTEPRDYGYPPKPARSRRPQISAADRRKALPPEFPL